MVEAVGVEPTSENATGQEPTYLVQFTQRELPRQIRVFAKNGQETQHASPNVSSSRPGVAEKTSLLCDALSQPVGEAVESGCLFN